jgi:hypothetical protein
MTTITHPKSSLLRTLVLLDGYFTILAGALIALAAQPIADVFQASDSTVFTVTGILLFLYAISMVYFGQSNPVPRWYGWLTIELDSAWALASLIIGLVNPFDYNTLAQGIFIITGCSVFGMAAAKYYGLRQQ